MVKVRQDAWSHEDDLLLAETVLRHIREGSTQLNAFEEVGDKLNRTSAACGFRWNAEIREKYDSAVDLAKRQRKEKKRANAVGKMKTKQPIVSIPNDYDEYKADEMKQSPIENTKYEVVENNRPAIINDEYKADKVDKSTITMDSVIQFLKQIKKDYHASNQSKLSLEQIQKENTILKEHVNELEAKLTDTEKQFAAVQEDYQVFLQIMDRARKMTVLDDQGSFSPPSFKMDKNGNLQQVADGSS